MKMKKRFLGILLTLMMVLGQMPGMSLTALAWDGDPYASLLNTTTVVNFDGKEWYLIENDPNTIAFELKQAIDDAKTVAANDNVNESVVINTVAFISKLKS